MDTQTRPPISTAFLACLAYAGLRSAYALTADGIRPLDPDWRQKRSVALFYADAATRSALTEWAQRMQAGQETFTRAAILQTIIRRDRARMAQILELAEQPGADLPGLLAEATELEERTQAAVKELAELNEAIS